MEAEKEKIVIGVRRYLIFQDHIIYFAVHRIMLTILIVPHYAELYTIVGRPNVFSYSELRSATENFNSSNLLGEGGYGSVYKVGFA